MLLRKNSLNRDVLFYTLFSTQAPITDMTKLKPCTMFIKKVDLAKQEDHKSYNAAFATQDNTVSRSHLESPNQKPFLTLSNTIPNFC